MKFIGIRSHKWFKIYKPLNHESGSGKRGL